jgi:hypothetical protein
MSAGSAGCREAVFSVSGSMVGLHAVGTEAVRVGLRVTQHRTRMSRSTGAPELSSLSQSTPGSVFGKVCCNLRHGKLLHLQNSSVFKFVYTFGKYPFSSKFYHFGSTLLIKWKLEMQYLRANSIEMYFFKYKHSLINVF